MLGGISIVRESSRHSIEKKLKDLKKKKNLGNITLEEYDTLRIRFERKLGNKEAVSKLQEAKGFKPSAIKEKKARREELYDEFVDKYSKSEGKDYGQIQRSNMFNKTTKRALVILFILLAFGIGIMAGFTAINNVQKDVLPNVTITDTAFSANATITDASNLTADTSNVSYNMTKTKATTTKKKTSTKQYSSSGSDSSKSSDSSSSGSGSSKKSDSSSSSSSGSSSSGSSRSSSGSSSSSSSSSRY